MPDSYWDDVLEMDIDKRWVCPTWDLPGLCICGTVAPAEKDWHDAGRDWAWWCCPNCGRGYVDEEDYTAIYEADVWASYEVKQ